MSNQLLPCPFCGAEPAPFWNGVGCVTAKCAMDGLHISIEAWNRRATQPAGGEPVAWMTRPRKGSYQGHEFLCQPDDSLNLDQWEKPFPVYAVPPAAAHGDELYAARARLSEALSLLQKVDENGSGLDGNLHADIQSFLSGNHAAHGDEAVRKDAERYRWLRDNGWPSPEDWPYADIDAAMRAQGDGEVV